MKIKQHTRFDPRTLRELAGDKAYARGEAYHRKRAVAIISAKPGRVVAQVSGSEDYRTELNGSGEDLDGSCTCRAFEDYGFCKHMVAAGLAANDADAAVAGADPLERIRDHLKTKSVDILVGMIVDLAERDPALFRKLDLAAAKLDSDDKALEARLRKALDAATRIRDYVDYAEASAWASGVEEALEAFADLASGAQAELAIRLAEHALERIEAAMGNIDDSDGHCGALMERARDIHLAACIAVKPDPVALARDLYRREMEGDFDTFHGAAGLYEQVLGESGLAEYRRLAEADWSKIPARMGKRRARDDLSNDGLRLVSILDFFAERDGDIDARIALRAKDLSSPWQYLRLAQFCLDQGRDDEALRRAEEGLWIFEDEPSDRPLVTFVAELLVKKGRKADAADLLWRAFESDPDFETYRRLAKIGGKGTKERAIALLEARSAVEKRWHGPSDILLEILIHEKMLDEAWAALRKHGASAHAREALAIYAEKVESLAGNAAYEDAVKLVKRMGKLRSAAEQAAYVTDLKERHRRKRNFMKLLG